MKKLILPCFTSLCISAASVSAATISWTADQIDATGVTQVSTNGTLLQASNFLATGDTTTAPTVNGVTFANLAGAAPSSTYFLSDLNLASSPGTGTSSGADFYPGGNSSYDALLQGALYSGADTLDNITLSSLSIGVEYEVQLFIADIRVIASRTRDVVIDGTTVASSVFGFASTYSGNGVIINGTFTADAATQAFELRINDSALTPAAGGNLPGQINAFQLRAVPEPSAFAFIIGALVLGISSTRRKRS